MVRISASKARETARHIQGLPAGDALDLLRFSPRKAAKLVGKTLKSAVANAENNNGLSVESLVVKSALINEGPAFKRFQPKARGMAGRIRKRTSHIHITVAEREEKPAKAPKKTAAKKQAAKKPAAKKAAAPKKAEEKDNK